MTETLLTNARVVTPDALLESGTVVLRNGAIADVSSGRSRAASAIDCEGDLLAPGLVELHTDNLEKHLLPRPKVVWPNALAALLAHDAQMVASGVTTVFDAVAAGSYEKNNQRDAIFASMVSALDDGVARGVLRIDHRLHVRCELSAPDLTAFLEPIADHPRLGLASLMDHTPGQRQWRNVQGLRDYITGIGVKGDEDVDAYLASRISFGQENVARNRPLALAILRGRTVLASHDDTTPEHVEEALEAGCAISEFPTTLEAAEAARARGLATIAGAPNVVRGGSHSGGVAVEELIRARALDALSSDYVPASLLQALVKLTDAGVLDWVEAFALVTSRPADMVGLADRGRILPGLRADLVRLRAVEGTPVVREVRVAGERVH